MRIMIVDDHEIVREGVRPRSPGVAGIEVVAEAATGREALRRVRQTLPDIALVDLRLPDMRGEELTRELSRDFPGTAVIILSTYLSEETVRGALQAGAAAYVTKAAGLPELLAAIERVRLAAGRRRRRRRARRSSSSCTSSSTSGCRARRPTPQQERVLELAAAGLHQPGDRQAAVHLGVDRALPRAEAQG